MTADHVEGALEVHQGRPLVPDDVDFRLLVHRRRRLPGLQLPCRAASETRKASRLFSAVGTKAAQMPPSTAAKRPSAPQAADISADMAGPRAQEARGNAAGSTSPMA